VAKIYGLRAGAIVPDAILRLIASEKIQSAKVEAIGGVRRLRLAYFNHRAKWYEEHRYSEFLEVTSLLGNATIKDGRPFLHLHGTFGRKDMSVIGGHIIRAEVFPLMEVVISPTTNRALRRFDERSRLNVIYRTLDSQ
jgi:predicted DNA-binding protein with PD1-like motif